MKGIVDIVIAVILLFFFFNGMKRGLIRQVFEIVGIVAAFIGAFYLAHHVGAHFERSLDIPYRLALVAAAVALFIGILVLFRFLGLVIKKVAEIALLGRLDKFGGGLLGAVKGVLLVSLLLVVILNLPFPSDFREELREDPLVGVMYPVLPVMFDLAFSRSPAHLSFDKVTRSDDWKALEEIKESVEEAEEGLRKTKKKIEEKVKGKDD